MKNLCLFFLLAIQCASGQALPDLSPYKTPAEKLQRLAVLCDSLYFAQDLDGEKRLAQ